MSRTKEFLIALAAASLAAVCVFFWGNGAYNDMAGLHEKANAAWSQVENQYQRRLDLVPNLVRTVEAHAAHERETLRQVIEARAAATAASAPFGRDPDAVRRFQAAQSAFGAALTRLLAVAERYPELQSSKGFRELQVQIEGTENRIAVERRRFNEAAREYNTRIRAFPATFLAKLFNFAPRPYFTASAGAETAPAVAL